MIIDNIDLNELKAVFDSEFGEEYVTFKEDDDGNVIGKSKNVEYKITYIPNEDDELVVEFTLNNFGCTIIFNKGMRFNEDKVYQIFDVIAQG